MPQTLAVVRLQKISQIPQDAVENTFAFAHADPLDATGADVIQDYLHNFYTAAGGGASAAIQTYLSESLALTDDSALTNFYDITGHLDGSPHGSPTFSRLWHLTDTGSGSLPDECAICLSVRTAYGTDVEFGAGGTRPRARDRGRIYLGPLATNVGQLDSSLRELFVSIDARQDITNVASVLASHTDFTWSVWSRTRAALEPISHGWVDDAFDTQRRRGQRATQRTTF